MSAWADQVDDEEATNGTLANKSDFPTLGEANKEAARPGGKGKSKKGTKLGLQEFLGKPGGGSSTYTDKSMSDKEILLNLPTAPRGGPREEGPPGGLGGGFRDYGGDREGRGSRFQRDDRPPREEREPSRADTVDDWGSTRKFVPGGDGGGFGGSRGFGGGGGNFERGDRPPREPRALSAADVVDDWGTARKFEPSGPAGPRGGFEDRERRGPERRFDGPPPISKADTEDSWGKGRDYRSAEPTTQSRGGFSGQRDSTADREERWGRRTPQEPSTSSTQEATSERPRLKLAPRSVPAGEQAAGGADERKPNANPFGAARPREEVLKEKGVDPIKEALKLEHGEVIRDDTPAEKELKAEVAELQKQLEELKASLTADEGSEGDGAVTDLVQQLDAKERDLLKMQAEEDDRVRFARGGAREARGPRREEPLGREGPGAVRKDRW